MFMCLGFYRHASISAQSYSAENPAISMNLHRVNMTHSKSVGIDIVVAVHNALNELKDMLASVDAFTTPPYHIHLVNDRSEKMTVYWLQYYQLLHRETVSIYHLVEPEVGYTYAVNLGISSGNYPYVLLLNTDVIVTPNWLNNMVACMQQMQHHGIVGPLSNAASYQSVPYIKTKDGKQWSKNELQGEWMPEGMSRAVYHLSDRVYPQVPFINGFCMLVKRVVFDSVGLFDTENFTLGYGEENDFLLRSKNAGFSAVIDDATYVFHHKTRSFSENEKKEQSKQGRKKLLKKHSNITVVLAEDEFRHTVDVSLKNIRERLQYALAYPDIFQGPSLRILFLLPSSRTGGGSTSVINEALEMQRIGIFVRIALWDKSFTSFSSAYPNASNLFIPWPKKIKSDTDYKTLQKLRSYGMMFDVVIATVWVSVYEMLEMALVAPTFLPAYYIQDYEPDFFPASTIALMPNVARVNASKSYGIVSNMGGVMYAKSVWLADKVYRTHGCEVHVVPAAIENLECQNIKTRQGYNSSAVRIVAMLRPKTPRRNSKFTYNILREAKIKFGSKLEVVTFGCSIEDASFMTNSDFDFTHLGVLNRSAISDLYTKTDVFLDLSLWQAYGRSAVEAMTCGNIAIITQTGGAAEFIRHGYNGFLVDITDKRGVLNIIQEVVQSSERLEIMQRRARVVREQLRLEQAVFARLHLLLYKLKERYPYRNYPPWEKLLRI